MLKKIWRVFLEVIQSITFALSIFVLIYLFLFRPHQVSGMSMFPNFNNRDFILSEKVTYRFREPQRGDVIIFKAPPSEVCAAIECEYIKRIVGLPGETVELRGNYIYINGQRLEEDYLPLNTITREGSFLSEGKPTPISDHYYLVLGDNRSGSRDGRDFGLINKEAIIGRAWIRYWPPDSVGLASQ
ncbi:signal peptidase I [Candidatus Shapirobacteria bacterium CG09_land_8_20_14_0_10_38_17]|uniref:Signal peptidase I n=1 Tax=Candidatus Shapirobacteria bacterium CG09_land_8_20_14_0_10_38_17 TaxID=1974884 RepID=A0A2H0WTU7_9BACT|nr:MAG: signal peptidase I [Candidatus Shapirobacteria bacterium CG09_land_8_20_14_0_10_38_17]